MIKKSLIAFAVVIVAILIFASTRPDTFQVSRSIQINAGPDKVFPLINDLNNFVKWSPYEKMDPNMKRTMGATSVGEGATYDWDGDKNSGAGRMTITKSVPVSSVLLNLDMLRPFKASNKIEFSIVSEGNGSKVTWTMSGDSPFISKLIGVFMNMDKMVGDQFEEGLNNLKVLAEKP